MRKSSISFSLKRIHISYNDGNIFKHVFSSTSFISQLCINKKIRHIAIHQKMLRGPHRYFSAPYRSIRPELSCKECALKNFTKFTGNNMSLNFFFNNIVGDFERVPSVSTKLLQNIWPRGLRCWQRNGQRHSAGLRDPPCYVASGDLWVESWINAVIKIGWVRLSAR